MDCLVAVVRLMGRRSMIEQVSTASKVDPAEPGETALSSVG